MDTNNQLAAEWRDEVDQLIQDETVRLKNDNDFQIGYEKGIEKGIEIGAIHFAAKVKQVQQNKYYFVYSIYSAFNQPHQPQTCVIHSMHPFQWCHRLNNLPINKGYDTTIVDWKEITKEEYDLFKKLEL